MDISKLIGSIFDNVKQRLIGPDSKRGLIFSYHKFDPKNTIEWVYRNALTDQYANVDAVDLDTVEHIKDRVELYLDKAKDNFISEIEAVLVAHDQAKLLASKSPIKDPEIDGLRKQVQVIRDKIKNSVDLITENELAHAQSLGAMDGIMGLARAMGVSDPTVFKIGVLDRLRCKYCWNLWTMSDGVSPRVYKMSELRAESGKVPYVASVSLTHPRCRDILTILAPGFGFTSAGNVEYKGKGYDEWKFQRKLD
jgi:hypothetical protein